MDLRDAAPHQFHNALAGISTQEDFFLKSTYDISANTGLKMKDVEENLQQGAANKFKARVKTASQVERWYNLSTGCSQLNETLGHAGIPINGIVEIFGQSGAGKTQLCLQLALMAQLPKEYGGLNKKVIYICTEKIFPSKRLQELITHFKAKYPDLSIAYDENILLEHIGDSEGLTKFIEHKLGIWMSQFPIGLVIIDSIAGCIRHENANANFIMRSKELLSIAKELNKLSYLHKAAIVCSNQATTDVLTNEVVPCLGLSWSNLITSRFQISRNYVDSIRTFRVVFSPHLAKNECKLLITNAGIVGISI